MLDRLKVLGIRCVLLTGKDRKRTYQILDKTDLKKYFSYVVTPNDVWFTKPHPEGIIHILDEMNCTNDEAMMVGDSINDILCASAAQVTSVQFSFLGKCKALVEADYIVENWIEFCDLVYKTV